MMQSRWLVRRQMQPAAVRRLVCFPYAGAGASVFRDWPALVGAEMDVVAVQLPGRETRLRERAVDDICALAECVAAELEPLTDVPVTLFGHSMGGVLAFEVARRLQRAGRGPATLVVSARRGPRAVDTEPCLHTLGDAAFVAEIRRRYDGIPQAVLEHPDLLALLLPTLRADVRALELYRCAHGPLLQCAVLALCGNADPRVHPDDLEAWRRETTGSFTSHVLPGGHFFLNTARAEVLQLLASALPLQLAARA
jgi:surfactin synthase thioesterase subunit